MQHRNKQLKKGLVLWLLLGDIIFGLVVGICSELKALQSFLSRLLSRQSFSFCFVHPLFLLLLSLLISKQELNVILIKKANFWFFQGHFEP